MTNEHHPNVPHHATRTEAPNGEGTAHPPRDGATQDRPILDGASEYYGDEAEEVNPRLGQEDPALIRHPETGEHTPTPEDTETGQ
ncbi:hypothetical protein FM113_05530 [Leucobacter sp. 7(1)]|uniref:hypothetical protein n=1 Tax=Leucobacter sp. 7(1) TaxID=1255613 RepID=UPI00097EF7C8|nr:hypothetical protein [Leucobacter sp. 7(1)]SJN09204.1 hypothetical protein FM113_05530 [Leucobacter sp. 7(1)]